MAFNLDGIANALRRFGVKVVEIDGWQYRGYAQQDLIAARGVLHHHTATGRLAFARSNCPSLGLLIDGHSTLPGPLCNLAGGRDGTIYVVATGVANHAGTGSGPGIPRDMGNHYLVGIEWESSGVVPWDWTIEQLAVMPLVGAALEVAYLEQLPPSERLQLAHYEYSDAGKIDLAGYPGNMDGLRRDINSVLDQIAGGPPPTVPAVKPKPKPKPEPKPEPKEWDEMASKKEIQDALREVLRDGAHLDTDVILKGSFKGKRSSPRTRFEYMPHETERTNAKIDGVALEQAKVNAKLDALTELAVKGNGLTKEEAAQILRDRVDTAFAQYKPVLIPAGEEIEEN